MILYEPHMPSIVHTFIYHLHKLRFLGVCETACHGCHTCQRGLRAHVSTCQKRANFSFLRANVPINVPTWQFFNLACHRAKAWQNFNLACQCAKRRAIFSTSPATSCANFPTIFQNNCFFIYFSIPNKSIPNIFYIFCIFWIYT